MTEIGSIHECEHAENLMIVMGTSDGNTWFLNMGKPDQFSRPQLRPITHCPWCNIELPILRQTEASRVKWGPCIRCGETEVDVLMYRFSEDMFDGPMEPTCRNDACMVDGIRILLPLASHVRVLVNIEILEEVREVTKWPADPDHDRWKEDHVHIIKDRKSKCLYCGMRENPEPIIRKIVPSFPSPPPSPSRGKLGDINDV